MLKNNDNKKINQINWLRSIGVEYYCSSSPSHYETTNRHCEGASLLWQSHSSGVMASEIDPSCLRAPRNDGLSHEIATVSSRPSNERSARSLSDSAQNLDELKQYVLNFDGCNLKQLANNTVFGDGNKDAIVMLIGEAPGAKEDASGIPFCGDSGKLLDRMLSSVNISRLNNAYITNVVFWRPPANRQPTNEEVEICRPFVEKHIALINPKLIILVGNVAATSLLGKNLGITKIRQEYYLYSNQYLTKPIYTTAIFHPAYLLRQPTQKKTSWYDLIRIKEFLDLSVKR